MYLLVSFQSIVHLILLIMILMDTFSTDVPGGIVSMRNIGSNNYSADAKSVRDNFRDYFSSPKIALSWQYDTATATENPFD